MQFSARGGTFNYVAVGNGIPVVPSTSKVLLEDNDDLLLEDNDVIMLEA